MQEFIEQRVTLIESSPRRRQVEDGSAAGTPQNGPAQKHLHAQGGRLSIAAHAAGALEFSEQVEQHQNAQKGRLGGKELAQAKIIRG